MATDTAMKTGIFERLGDAFNGAIEGSIGFVSRLFGSANERAVKATGYLRPRNATEHTVLSGSILDKTNKLEGQMKALSDDALRDLSIGYRERVKNGESLESLMPEAFAACREAARRTKGMRHYDVQIVGGAIMHGGNIAEMVTGEGKTLVATLAAYLNALTGQGVHVITVNDYLARRDCEWMLPIYNALGVSAAFIQSDQDGDAKRFAYNCDITYGTSSEFGFDYLRDNMKPARFDDDKFHPYYRQCQRTPLNFAIIDEVDNILIDEARTPLIISGPAFSDPRQYEKADDIARKLTELERKARHDMKAQGKMTLQGTEGDGLPVMLPLDAAKIDPQDPPPKGVYFEIKEKEKTCHLTDAGVREAEKLADVESFYTSGNMEWPHLIDNALRAHHIYQIDRNYMIAKDPRENDQLGIIIIDEFTGRAMFGRQWSDGLHQSVEAKHRKQGVQIKQETQTLATVTLQNFFRLYKKLGGMTGTAMTEANEFWKIYKLDVVAIPTNKPLQRVNAPDLVYKSDGDKWDAVMEEVVEVAKTGRPILIGTTDVANSERLSGMLKRKGVKHELLNAKPENVAREAEIVAQAGRLNAVTISTNMAGRGTDIILGGNAETLAWAILKNTKDADGRLVYPTRLEIPNDVWAQTIADIEAREQMKAEGRKVAEMGGLHIVGTERHESRRIDNQLRGRAGRQGDPGSSKFYLSLEDGLMRMFGGERLRRLMNSPWIGMKDGEALESNLLTKQIEKAQRRVEEYHFDQRKNLLEYDEVMDYQRKRIYGVRQGILDGQNPRFVILQMIDEQIVQAAKTYSADNYGQAAYAAYAANELGIEFEPSDFRGANAEEAVQIAHGRAADIAPTFIGELMDENMNPDEDAKDWKWQEFSRAINARYSLKTTDRQLKTIGRDGLHDYLAEEATKAIDAVDLSAGARFLEPNFGAESLADWARLKFTLKVSGEELAGKEAGELVELLKRKVRETYRQKDIEFPVQIGMSKFMPAKTTPDRRPDRDQLYRWAAGRFAGANGLNEEMIRTDSRPKIQEMLGKVAASVAPTKDYPELLAEVKEIFSGTKVSEAADANELVTWAREQVQLDLDPAKLTGVSESEAMHTVLNAYDLKYRPEMHQTERGLVLEHLDAAWKAHLLTMDHLRSVVGLAGYAQEDPKIIYKREGMKLFDDMEKGIQDRVSESVFRMEDVGEEAVDAAMFAGQQARQATAESAMTARRQEAPKQEEMQTNSANEAPKKIETIRNAGSKVGRNDPCPCGSGKKYKNCHMKSDAA